MDIFKLIFEHDIRLDDLRARHTDRNTQDQTLSIEEFMNPDPTYSKFYITGSHPDENRFGLNILDHYESVIDQLQLALSDYSYHTEAGQYSSLKELLKETSLWQAILLTKGENPVSNFTDLHIDTGSNVGHRKVPLRNALMAGELVLYKEQAHHGFDLHLFSRENIYRDLFFPLKELVSDHFRFFSINGKRIQSERTFYFETWALDRPPHGVEEVYEETVL
jgi:hypothetical protein